MKTIDEIFLFLCKNSNYYRRPPIALQEKKNQYKEIGKCIDKKHYYFVETLVPAFECELSILEKFLGESYDFSKHMKPLIDKGLVYIRPFVNCFPHCERLEKESLSRHGLVGDCNDIGYLHWYLGCKNPNENHNIDNAWL